MTLTKSSTNYSTDWCILSKNDVVNIKREFREHIWIYFKSEHLANNNNKDLPKDVTTDDSYFLCQVALDDEMEELLENRVTGFTENATNEKNVIKREDLYGGDDMYITPHLSFVCNKNNVDGMTQLCHRWNKKEKKWIKDEGWTKESVDDENIYSSLMIDLHRTTVISDTLKSSEKTVNKSETISDETVLDGIDETTNDGTIFGTNISTKIGTNSRRLVIDANAGLQNDGLSLTDIAEQFIFDVNTLEKWLSGEDGNKDAVINQYIELFFSAAITEKRIEEKTIDNIKKNVGASFKPPTDHVIPYHMNKWKKNNNLDKSEYKEALGKSLFYGEHILNEIPERISNAGKKYINNDVKDAIYKLCDMFEYTKCLMNDALEDDTQSNDGLFSINRDNVFKMTNALNEESYTNFKTMLGKVKINNNSKENKYSNVNILDAVRTWSYVSIESLTTSNMFTDTLAEKINKKLEGLSTGSIVDNTYKINILMMPSVLRYIHAQVTPYLKQRDLSDPDKFTYMRYLSFIREMLYSILESIENIRMASKQYSLQINVNKTAEGYSIGQKTTKREGVVSMREDIKKFLNIALDKQNQGNISVFLRLNDRYYHKGRGNYEAANMSYNIYNPRFYIGMDKQPNPKEMTFGYDHTMGIYKNTNSEFTMIDNKKSKWINDGFVTVENGKYKFNPTGKDPDAFNKKLDVVFKKYTNINDHSLPSKHTKFYKFGKYNEIFTPNLDNKTIAKQDSIKTGIIDVLNAGKNVFVMGYGSSGAGKTSSLVYLDKGRGGEQGIMVEICNKIECEILTVSIMEQGQKATIDDINTRINDDDINTRIKEKGKDDGDDPRSSVLKKCVDVEFTKEKEDGTWVLSNDWCTKYQNPLAYIKTLKFNSRKKVASDSLKKIKGGETTLGKFLEILIDKDRHVMATTNNPQSSRSHVLAFIKFKGIDGVKLISHHAPECHSKEDATATLIVGDFAGVENEFNHKDVQNTLVKYANVKKNNENSLFYDVDGLNKDLGPNHRFAPRDDGNKMVGDELTLDYFHGMKYITNQAKKALTIPTTNNEDVAEVHDFVNNYLSDDDIDAGDFVPIIQDMWRIMWDNFEKRKNSTKYFNTFLQREIKLPGFNISGTLGAYISDNVKLNGKGFNITSTGIVDIRDELITKLSSYYDLSENRTFAGEMKTEEAEQTITITLASNGVIKHVEAWLASYKTEGTKKQTLNYHTFTDSFTEKEDSSDPGRIRYYSRSKIIDANKNVLEGSGGMKKLKDLLDIKSDLPVNIEKFKIKVETPKIIGAHLRRIIILSYKVPLLEKVGWATLNTLNLRNNGVNPTLKNEKRKKIQQIFNTAITLNGKDEIVLNVAGENAGENAVKELYQINNLTITKFGMPKTNNSVLFNDGDRVNELSEKEKETLKEMFNYLRYRMLIADAVAKKRTTEGKYINTALSDLRQDIKNSLFLKNHDTFLNFPSVASTCREYHCLNPKAEVGGVHRMNCSGVSECSLYVDSILDDDNKSTINDNGNRLLTMKSDGTFIKGSNCIEEQFKKTNLVIFGVLNIAVGSNDPPPLEYVDINPIKRANLDNGQFLKLFHEGLVHLPAVIKDKFKDKYGEYLDGEELADHGLHDDLDQTEFIEFIDQYNAPAAISTLEFFDNMISFLRTNSSCELDPKFDAKTKDYLSLTCGYVNAKLKTGEMQTDSIVKKFTPMKFKSMGGKLSINMKTKKQRRTRRKKQQRTRKLQMFTN